MTDDVLLFGLEEVLQTSVQRLGRDALRVYIIKLGTVFMITTMTGGWLDLG